jgi:hypothetical protein
MSLSESRWQSGSADRYSEAGLNQLRAEIAELRGQLTNYRGRVDERLDRVMSEMWAMEWRVEKRLMIGLAALLTLAFGAAGVIASLLQR